MNIEKINNLADLLETAVATRRGLFGKIGFNMREWVSDDDRLRDLVDECKTTACLAGWTILAEDEDLADETVSDVKAVRYNRSWFSGARDILGLDLQQADKLFSGGGAMGISIISRSPAEAAATLRHLAATGEVVWFPEPVVAGAPVGDGR